MLEFLLGYGALHELPATAFDQEHALDYFNARTKGLYRRHEKAPLVGRRVAQYELQTLRTALNWAYSTKVDGRRLVKERVFDGLLIPGAGPVTQPSVTADVFAALWAVRTQVHPAFACGLALAQAYGKRGDSIRHLEWSSVRWLEHELFWAPAHDKEEESGVFWLPPDVEAVLDAWWKHTERPASRWVFAAPENADMPVGRRSFARWLEQAYRHAGLTKPRQAGWHSFRRWFTTRNSGADAKAAMTLAGMKNAVTFFRYQQPEGDALKRVLQNRPLLALE